MKLLLIICITSTLALQTGANLSIRFNRQSMHVAICMTYLRRTEHILLCRTAWHAQCETNLVLCRSMRL